MGEPETKARVHVLKVTLAGMRPAVWRRLEVPSAITLDALNDVLQAAFGWSDLHLHEFEARGVTYGTADGDLDLVTPWDRRVLDESRACLAQLAPRPTDVARYTYDFGDNWQHRLLVEEIRLADPDQVYPVCTAGSGQAPEEDTGEVRPGRFDEAARRRLNAQLAALPGGGRGRELPLDGPTGRRDDAFDALFPDLVSSTPDLCTCGTCDPDDVAGAAALPAANLAPNPELADLAADSPLVRRAVALATWLGESRPVTPAGLPRPADAAAAVADLALDERLLPGDEGGAGGRRPHRPHRPHRPRSSGRSSVRSAKDLPGLHAVWSAAVAAGLIDVRGGKARPGAELAVWREASTPQARIESWARLLAGYLRARDEVAPGDHGRLSLNGALAASAPLLYVAARHPVSVAALAVGLLDGIGDAEALLNLPDLVTELSDVVEDWLVAGVLSACPEGLVTTLAEQPGAAGVPSAEDLTELLDELRTMVAAAPPAYRAMADAISGVVDDLERGPALELTSLGDYGLARLLTAHGWELPIVGACVDVPPSDLLDRLAAYLPPDAAAEARGWFEARGAGWEAALSTVLATAATKASEGPVRRAVLTAVLGAAGPSADPVLAGWQADPWLASVVASARHEVGTGPRPTLAQVLWLAVDGLSAELDADDEDFTDAVDDIGLTELLAQPGAVTAAAGLGHPHAGEVLRRALPAIEDPGLRRGLRKALMSGSPGHPAAGSRHGRTRPGRGPRRR